MTTDQVAATAADDRVALAYVAAGLSLGAGFVHASVMPSHFREYFLFGLFFLIITPLQLAWAEAVRRAPDDRRLLVAGAVGNLTVVGVWLVTRTTGLPFGPHRLQAEATGLKDLISTYDEAMIAGVVALILWRSARFRAPRWLLAAGWTLAAASVTIAFVPGGH